MIRCINKCIIWAILFSSLQDFYLFCNFKFIYRISAACIASNPKYFRKIPISFYQDGISDRIVYKQDIISKSYSFVSNPVSLSHNEFVLYANKPKTTKKGTTPSKKSGGKSTSKGPAKGSGKGGGKGAGKGGGKSKASSKKSKPTKAELSMLRARAKAKKEKQKKEHIFGRSKVTLEEEDKEELEKEYQRRISITDTPSYTQKLSMDLILDQARPYMSLFDEEIVTKNDLLGFDMPYGLVPRERYELWKLCGRISDPCAPFSSQSLTTRMFVQRLFGNKYEISRDDFNYKIEYKMKFYTPGYGDIFFMDKIRCWKAYYLTRDYKYGPEDLPTYTTMYPLARPEDNVPLSTAMLAVNAEINRQGVHPSLLDMLWDFFNKPASSVSDGSSDEDKTDRVLNRDVVTYKLNWLIERLENRDEEEGISPDNFYRIFYEKAKQYINNFDMDLFIRDQLRNLHIIDTHKMMLMNNRALRRRNKILREAYNDDLKSLYAARVPRTYKRYERARLAGYFNMLNHMYEMRERRKVWVEPEEPEPEVPLSHEDELFEREVQKYAIKDKRKEEMKRRKARRSKGKK
ncbi:uncharacterized protein TA21105 [Theileria annulata]|uniref:Uncharacterized protein n=1 Tax=Theileria annulata TaxID=5874 RepID=Q4UGT5_THEAN|nr:uncharacterized protein TA21105 [Theileria annulata]CAI73704.1 hypothetical protein TA21105 [Theileria annulata]|eukprot:XP_954381.1 hypothetical protein TA21105 [Theileria annulata]